LESEVAAGEAGSGASTDEESGQDAGSDEDTDTSDEEEELIKVEEDAA